MKPGVEKYFFAAAAACCWLAADARAQLGPLDSFGSVTNGFSSVTYFEPPNDERIQMRLSGAEASSLPDALVDLKKMKVEKFRTDGKLEAVVEAPQCIYAPFKGVANSAGHLQLKSGDGNFRVEGDGFLWLQNEQLLTISNHVHTVIERPAGKTSFFL